MAVPVEFGAVATVGDSYINCNGASEKDICTDCEVMPPIPPGGRAPGLTARLRPEPGYAPSAHYLTASRPVRGLLLHPGKKRHRQREPLPV